MRPIRWACALAAFTLLPTAASIAGPCGEQIKQLEQSAKKTDAKNNPGSQEQPTDTGAAKTPGSAQAGGPSTAGQTSAAAAGTDGGGTKSASAKILEAQAHDQRGDEPGCMKALEEAKKLTDS